MLVTVLIQVHVRRSAVRQTPNADMGDVGRGVSSMSMYCLKSALYPNYLTSGLGSLLEDEESGFLTDVTLGCDGQFIQAHRVVLALSSPYFKEFFRINRVDSKVNHPLILLANLKFKDLRNIVQFIYQGKVTISSAELEGFLETAKILQIQGLETELIHQGSRSDSRSSTLRITSPSPNPNVKKLDPSSGSTRPSPIPTNPCKRPRIGPASVVNRTITNVVVSSSVSTNSSTSTTAKIVVQSPSSSSVAVGHQQEHKSTIRNVASTTANYDPWEDDEEEGDEEMISMDSVKVEPIEVYPSYEAGSNVSLTSMPETDASATLGSSGRGGVEYPGYVDGNTSQHLPRSSSATIMSRQANLSTIPESVPSKPTDEDSGNPLGVFNALGLSFTTPTKEKEMMIRCNTCNKVMGSEEFSSSSHTCVQLAATGVVNPVPCPLCGKTFKNRNSLKVHKSTYHRKIGEGSPTTGVRLKSLGEVYPDGGANFNHVQDSPHKLQLFESMPVKCELETPTKEKESQREMHQHYYQNVPDSSGNDNLFLLPHLYERDETALHPSKTEPKGNDAS